MIGAGMDVARLNFSHGTYATHALVIERLRRIAGELDRPLAVLPGFARPQDAFGAGARHWSFHRPRRHAGCSPLIRPPLAGDALPVQYAPLAREVRPGGTILIDDGRVEVQVRATDDPLITCEVVRGGLLRSFKGLNLPGATLSVPTLTAKDRADVAWGSSARR